MSPQYLSGTYIAGQEPESFYNRELESVLSKMSDKEISGLQSNLTARIEELVRLIKAAQAGRVTPTTDYTAIIQQLIGGKR